MARPAAGREGRRRCGSRSPAPTRASAAARRELTTALADPARALEQKVASRAGAGLAHEVDLPGDPLLEQSITWSKQNLADSVAGGPRPASCGRSRRAASTRRPSGTLAKARWLGAGWPDYPWLFGTDGEYTAFASVAMGQFADIKAHLRALRDVSAVVNGDSGKVVHEVMPDGSVYYGTLDSAGNTDETSKFPSAVALIWRWTGDDAFRDDLYPLHRAQHAATSSTSSTRTATAGPRGSATSSAAGMGEEKLDNTVYTIRGLRDLADLARSSGRRPRPRPGPPSARPRWRPTSRHAWWYGGDAHQYADSLDDPATRPTTTPRSCSGTGSA